MSEPIKVPASLLRAERERGREEGRLEERGRLLQVLRAIEADIYKGQWSPNVAGFRLAIFAVEGRLDKILKTRRDS